MNTKARLYMELHITVDARPGLDFEAFKAVLHPEYWRASRFDEDLVDNYSGKWFLSARCPDEDSARKLLKDATKELTSLGYTVLRWKAEDTLLDSKYGDTLE